MENQYAVWIGIDWADKKNVCAVQVAGSEKVKISSFSQTPAGIDDWVQSLKKLAKGGKVAIALEQKKGALIFALMKYDFIFLFPLNPNSFAKYREVWAPSGAKDDPTDASFILDLLVHHHKKLTAWVPEPKEVRLLQRLTEQRVKVVNDLKRVGNRLTSTLKEYFPEVLEIFPTVSRNIVCEFLLVYPTLEIAKKASDLELHSFFRSHSSGNAKLAAKRIAIIQNALPLTTDFAVISSNALLVKGLARELKVLNQIITEYETEIETIYCSLPDSKIFNSLPSAGEVSAPRLLAAMGTDRSKFNSAQELACFLGIAPVLERSGSQCWIHTRFKCSKPLKQAFIEWTFLSLRSSYWADELYKKIRAKGKAHSVAIRAIAFKWVRIIFRCWKNNTTYSEVNYLKALRKAGSPLASAQMKSAT